MRLQIASSTLGKDALISDHRAHTSTAAAVGVAPVRVARTEVQAEGAARDRRALRGRPVVAVRTGIVEAGGEAAARCWQEDDAAVGLAGELTTFHTIHRRPFVGAVVAEFHLLVVSWHHPGAAPLHTRHVVLRAGDVRSEIYITTILVILIGARIIIVFLLRLTSGVVPTIVLRCRCSHVAASPLRARGQAEVDEVRMVVIGTGEVGF